MNPRNKILLIGAVCCAPLVLGTLAYYYQWDVGAPGNYGELIAPTPLAGEPFERLRGKWLDYKSIPALTIFHPEYLIQNPTQKRVAWEDLQLLQAKLKELGTV
jgi:uracil-DNA glycosylase